jgi:Zn-dependent protease with chaperone function
MKLNAFVFPTITQFRFALVCLLLVTTCFEIGKAVYWIYHEDARAAFLNQALKVHSTTEAELSWIAFMQMGAIRFHLRMSLLWGLIAAFFSLVLTAILYYAHPAWLIRKHCFRHFDGNDFPAIEGYINALLTKADLPYRPRLVWNPVDPSPSGAQVFGTLRRPHIGVSGGLIATFYQNATSFSAVFLHELAHIKNKDVGKTYLMIALWLTVLINCIAWCAAIFTHGLNERYTNSQFYSNLVELLFTAGVAAFNFYSFLRARELYADLRAFTWEEPKGGLLSLLKHNGADSKAEHNLLQTHPTSRARRSALEDPDQLLRMGFWDAFSTGVMAILITNSAVGIAQWLVAELTFKYQVPTQLAYLFLLVSLVCISLVLFFPLVSSVGIEIWWNTFRKLLRGYGKPDASKLGAGVALGTSGTLFVLFFPVLLEYIRSNSSLESNNHMISNIVITVIIGTLALYVAFSSTFKWLEICASSWIEVTLVSRFPRCILITSLIVCSLLSALFVSICGFVVTGMIAFLINRPGTLGEHISADQLPYIALVVGTILFFVGPLLWIIPLSASFNRRTYSCVGVSSWAFLETTGGEFRLASAKSPELISAVIVGIISGCIYCAVYIAVFHIHFVNHYFFQLAHFFNMTSTQKGLIILTIFPAFAQVTASIIIASKVQYLNTLLGIFSANVAGYTIVIGVSLLDKSVAKSLLDFAEILSLLTGLGTLLSLPFAYLATLAKCRIAVRR